MSLSASARVSAVTNAIVAANPLLQSSDSTLSADEKAQLTAQIQSSIQTVFGTDLTYLLANTVVRPTSMQAPPGATVSTTGSAVAQTGATTSAVAIGGTGTIS